MYVYVYMYVYLRPLVQCTYVGELPGTSVPDTLVTAYLQLQGCLTPKRHAGLRGHTNQIQGQLSLVATFSPASLSTLEWVCYRMGHGVTCWSRLLGGQ